MPLIENFGDCSVMEAAVGWGRRQGIALGQKASETQKEGTCLSLKLCTVFSESDVALVGRTAAG